MSSDGDAQLSLVERVPVELVQMILGALPDVTSLQAAALSCPLFFYAFLAAETSITTLVFLGQIDVRVLPEAMAASESSFLRPFPPGSRCSNVIREFTVRHLSQRLTPPTSWTLKKAIHIGRLHFYVNALAQRFATSALTAFPLHRTSPIATRQEMCRIERALYLFEMYCNLFSEIQEARSTARLRSTFLQKFFAPWEIEQLGCIHDFLISRVTKAVHDVAKGYIARQVNGRLEYDCTYGSPFLNHVLTFGLKKIYEIANATTDDERRQLLVPESQTVQICAGLHFYTRLQKANGSRDDVFISDLTPEGERLYIRSPFSPDPSSGSATAWRWAYGEETLATWVYQENRGDLRSWGYVMWDMSRLEASGFFDRSWDDEEDEDDWYMEDEQWELDNWAPEQFNLEQLPDCG